MHAEDNKAWTHLTMTHSMISEVTISAKYNNNKNNIHLACLACQ